jgi:hypothetical protein
LRSDFCRRLHRCLRAFTPILTLRDEHALDHIRFAAVERDRDGVEAGLILVGTTMPQHPCHSSVERAVAEAFKLPSSEPRCRCQDE